jgi:hypothetical protein
MHVCCKTKFRQHVTLLSEETDQCGPTVLTCAAPCYAPAAQKAMKIAAETCVYTNSNFTWEIIRGSEIEGGSSEGGGK